MRKGLIIIIVIIVLLVIAVTSIIVYSRMRKNTNVISSPEPPYEVIGIKLPSDVAVLTSYPDKLLVFSRLSVYEFQTDFSSFSDLYPDLNSSEVCVPMREFNVHKAYFSCGKKDQRIIVLEGVFTNETGRIVYVQPGQFRIPLEPGVYLNPSFTTKDRIKVEPGVRYTFRVPFENIESLPPQFVIEHIDRNYQSSFKLNVNLNTKDIEFVPTVQPSPS